MRSARATATALIAAAVLALVASGCGGGSTKTHTRAVSLVLDFTPNAIHSGIYSAIARHYDGDAGIRLRPVAPSASTDSIKLLESGRADFAILDIHDLAIAREQGHDIVGIMALVQRPLAALIAAPPLRSPRQLEGTTVGITGVPSDTAVLHSIMAGSGGNPRRVRTVTIGFNAVPALLSRRVSAATAFWNDEGVTLRRKRPGFHVFRVDSYGAPSYPELVVCATRKHLRDDPAAAGALVRTLVRGYDETIRHPRDSTRDLESRVPGLDPQLVAAQLAAELPVFAGTGGVVGELSPGALKAWAAWEARFGIVRRAPAVSAAFDPRFLTAPR